MNILESFEAYIASQRAVGTNFLILGGILIVLAVIAHFTLSSSVMTIWLKSGLIVCGLLIAAGGWSYGNFNEKVSKEGHSQFEKDPAEFAQTEAVRMDKVVKQFPYYQITFAAFIILSLIVVLFVPSPAAKGIAFAVIALMAGCLLVEQVSHSSIVEYAQSLNK